MKSAIKKAKCISLALDECTTSGVFLMKRRENSVSGLTALHGHTRGHEIHEALVQMLIDGEKHLKHVISISTDGDRCMTGRERGLVARLRAHHPDLTACHCIIHQMVLCASL